MLILTAVSKIAIDFGKPDQRPLDRVSLQELKALQAKGISRSAAWVLRLRPRSGSSKEAVIGSSSGISTRRCMH